MGQNFSLYCGYRIGGVPMPLITWSYDNGLSIEPMLVGPDTSGAYYRYIPQMKEGNKTLKMVSTQMKKKQTEEISSREFELAKSFAGKYVCLLTRFFQSDTVKNVLIQDQFKADYKESERNKTIQTTIVKTFLFFS